MLPLSDYLTTRGFEPRGICPECGGQLIERVSLEGYGTGIFCAEYGQCELAQG